MKKIKAKNSHNHHHHFRNKHTEFKSSSSLPEINKNQNNILLEEDHYLQRSIDIPISSISTITPLDLDDQLPNLLPALRELLKDDADCVRKDDEFLTTFLRVKNYNVEKAAVGVRKYYENIQFNSDILVDIRTRQLQEVYNDHWAMVLAGRCKLGSIVGLVRAGSWDTKKHTLTSLKQSGLFLVEECTRQKQTQLQGVSIIFDCIDLSWCHMIQLRPRELKALVLCGQGGFPSKIIAVHVLNYPRICWALYYLASGFMKEKLRSRVHFHSNYESLAEYFDMSTLPNTIGGSLELPDAIDREMLEKLLKNNPEFKDYHT